MRTQLNDYLHGKFASEHKRIHKIVEFQMNIMLEKKFFHSDID